MRINWSRILLALLAASAGSTLFGFEEPAEVLNKFLSRVRRDLERLPDFVCTQTVERFSRADSLDTWRKSDTLHFEVAVVGSRELYARPGERKFDSRPLAEMVGRGTIGTGQFSNLAKLVFATGAAQFTFRGRGQRYGRDAYEWDYDVPLENSGYKLRSGPAESKVAFQGTFWVDVQTLDLIRLEVQAYDMPQELGLAQADTDVVYSRIPIEGVGTLLPINASLRVMAVDGEEDLNRTRLDRCRQYTTESAIRFDAIGGAGLSEADRLRPTRETEIAQMQIPVGAILDFALDNAFDPETASLGEEVSVTLIRPLKQNDSVLLPEGTRGLMRLVRLDRHTTPFTVFDLGMEFESLVIDGRPLPLSATMEEAGPASGLMKQAKRLDPTFTKRRSARMDILVREVQQGQGILNWDGRKGPMPRGLKMKWRVTPETK